MKKVIKAVAVFLALVIIAASALFSSSKVITAYNEQKGTDTEADLGIELSWKEKYSDADWIEAESSSAGVPFDSKTLWEPGYTETRYFRVKNGGTVSFDYALKIDPSDLEYEGSIADVIDVYVSYDTTEFSSLISDSNKIGTLADCFSSSAFFSTVSNDDDDNLTAGEESVFAVGFKMRTDAGNDYQGYTDTDGVKQNKAKFSISAAASAPEPEPVADDMFGLTFETYDNYQPESLYRVGNANEIKVLSLFTNGENGSDIDASKISFEWVNKQSYFGVSLTYTASTTEDWRDGTFKFSGEGVGTLWLEYDGVKTLGLDLEVLTAKNVVTSSDIATSSYNAVLLNDISASGGFTITKCYTLYGNGFTIKDERTATTGSSGICNMSGGTLDNVHIKGQEYASFNMFYSTNDYFAPCVRINNNTNYPQNYIYNSHISGCSEALYIAADTYMDNTLVSGGAVANIDIISGNLTMNNCATALSLEDGEKGLSVYVQNKAVNITLNGTFRQYNWVMKSDFPSEYSSYVSSVYSDSEYAASYNGNTYISLGFMCASNGLTFDEDTVKAIITDNTGNNYGYKTKKVGTTTATCYLEKAPTEDNTISFLTEYNLPGQSPTVPASGVSYAAYNGFNISNGTSNPNYKAMTDLDSPFCIYDTNSRMIKISKGSNSAYEWNPMILPVKKYGNSVSYTVSMNGTDYTNKKIPFSGAGTYIVEYTINDTEHYYKNSGSVQKGSVSYTKTLSISVTGEYNPEFTFGSNSQKVQVVNNQIWVMPDVTETSTSIGSKTVNGITVYYPIISLNPTNSDGTEDYESGNGAYYTPVFKDVNITDYYQTGASAGTAQYTYNTSTETWPHNMASDKGPDSSIFGYAADGSAPYGTGVDDYCGQTFVSGKGLCYARTGLDHGDSNGIAASVKTVHWYYSSNDGLTYNYYVQYSFSSWSYNACFAFGTMITLADGSSKPIEDVTYSDKLLTWNFFSGNYDNQSVAILVDHGKATYNVVNSVYSDGTCLRTIGEHGVFDYDLNEYVYLTQYNCEDYIGHRFVKYNPHGGCDIVIMTDAYVTKEKTNAYSITSARTSNAFAEGLLTVAPPDEFYNWVDMGEKLRYDTEAFNADVEKYGLYDYDVFSDYVTYEQYMAFNGPYLKVAVEKGKFSFDYILQLISTYL